MFVKQVYKLVYGFILVIYNAKLFQFMKYLNNFLVCALCLLSTFSVQSQCAMCRAVLESQESTAAAEGINNGIVYLMLFPYLLVGGVGYVVYKMRQNKA